MLVWKEQKLGFIHIPKTAGTSIQTYLVKKFGAYGFLDEGCVYHGLLSNIDVDYSDYNIFTVVRDPLDRVKSFYRWFLESQDESDFIRYPYKELAKKYNFNTWLKVWYIPKGVPQSDYFLIGDSVPKNVTILKYENLYEEIEKYFKNLNIIFDKEEFPFMYKTTSLELKFNDYTKKAVVKKSKWLYKNNYYTYGRE